MLSNNGSMWSGRLRIISALLLIAYSAMLTKVIVFKDMPTINVGTVKLNFAGTASGPANFVPFKTIAPYLMGENGRIIAGVNLIGNVALLMPIGILVAFARRSLQWKFALCLAIGTSVGIETVQQVMHIGIFDIDDVMLNAIGFMAGCWAVRQVASLLRTRQYARLALALAMWMTAAAAATWFVYPHDARLASPDHLSGGEIAPARTSEEGASKADLCGSTSGTGEIVGLRDHTFSLQRNDGVVQQLALTESTSIKTSEGSVSAAELHVGDRVTVVVLDKETATLVLVCGATP